LTVEASKPGNLRSTITSAHLKEAFPINNRCNDRAHVKSLSAIPGYNFYEVLIATVNRIITVDDRCQLINIVGHIRQKAPDLSDAGRLIFGTVINSSILGVYLPASQLILGFLFTHCSRYYGRPSSQYLRCTFRHD